jgi:cytochrome c-type biogenesis protein
LTAWWLAAGGAMWLGILTSISPCPLATNITAMSFVAKRVARPSAVLFSGVLYTLGRALTYLVLGVLLVSSLLSAPQLSLALQQNMNRALGPILILVGMILLDLLVLPRLGRGTMARAGERVGGWGVWGAGLLGILFALSFCPVSAALFFGSLLPLAAKVESRATIPALYGVGTAVPVLIFAGLLAAGSQSVSRVFKRLTGVEKWARRATGAVFAAAGIYYTLVHLFRAFG